MKYIGVDYLIVRHYTKGSSFKKWVQSNNYKKMSLLWVPFKLSVKAIYRVSFHTFLNVGQANNRI